MRLIVISERSVKYISLIRAHVISKACGLMVHLVIFLVLKH